MERIKIYRRRKEGPEHKVQNAIIAALRADNCKVYRINVLGTVYKDKYGHKRYIKTGVPRGFPDLFGIKLSDQKGFYIEVKRPDGGKPSYWQKIFHYDLMHDRSIHGVAHSVQDALKIVDDELVGYGYSDVKHPTKAGEENEYS